MRSTERAVSAENAAGITSSAQPEIQSQMALMPMLDAR